jgi:hypothetical protein
MYGERYRHAAANESMCFQRALEQWQFCGSHKREPVVAIYGPTGMIGVNYLIPLFCLKAKCTFMNKVMEVMFT